MHQLLTVTTTVDCCGIHTPHQLLLNTQQVLRLRGGAKKRKKKTYTKPKKVKGVHKTVKLAVLKFYSVDDAGKVSGYSTLYTACNCTLCCPFGTTAYNLYVCEHCT
jgi:hypothetical protein